MRLPLKIGLDLDGVIIDHTENKLALAAERGLALEPWQTNSNVMGNLLPPEDYREIRDQVYADLTSEAPAVKGALESLGELEGELFIVSARRADTVRYAQNWLDRNRVYDLIPAERIFFCGDETEKKLHCHRLNLQMYLDDKLQVLTLLPLTVRRVLFDNHGLADRLELPQKISVVNDWAEFLRLSRRSR